MSRMTSRDTCRCWCCLEPVPLEAEGQSQGQPLGTRDQDGLGMVYRAMLRYCFNIRTKPSDNDRIICNLCIHKLRESCSFRNQVEEAQWRLSVAVDETDVKTELATEYLSEEETPFSPETYEKVDEEDGTHFKTPEKKIKKKNPWRYKCPECPERFKCDSTQIKHMVEVHGCVRREYPCGVCSKTYASSRGRNFHFETHHLEKKHKCEKCNKAFPFERNLEKHMAVHMAVRIKDTQCDTPHICHVCGKSCPHKKALCRHLSRHRARPQGPKTKVQCPICGKHVAKSCFHQHKKAHEGYSYSKCPECPQRFKNHYSRLLHMEEVHGRPRPEYPCKVCSMTFKTTGARSTHVRRDHLKVKPEHKCEVCDLAFFRKGQLRTHMQVHTGELPFECEICLKRYSRKHLLNGHLEKHKYE